MKKVDKTQILLEFPELFQATLKEFSDKNYNQASTNEIIKVSKTNKGSFYYRFSNKEELFVALMDYVFVIQIDLYNKRNINIISLEKLEDILYELFYNLYQLYHENPMYYKLTIKQLSDPESTEIIKNYCIEPLKLRFYRKLDIFSYLKNYENIMLFVDTMYHNFPEKIFNSHNFNLELENLISFLLAEVKENNHSSIDKIINTKDIEFEESISFLLIDDYNVEVSDKYTSLLKTYLNYKTVKKKLFRMRKFYLISFKSLILNLIKNSFKDITYLLALLNQELLKVIKKNKELKKIVLSSLYLSLKEEAYIVIDLVNEEFSQKEIELFYRHILPIMSKTSKILVLSKHYSFDIDIKKIYIFDQMNQIVTLDFKTLDLNLNDYMEIEYIEKNKLLTKTLKIDEFSEIEFYSFIKEHKIYNLRMIKKIDYQTVMRNEVNL